LNGVLDNHGVDAARRRQRTATGSPTVPRRFREGLAPRS
jgi:hypothetical protein